MDVTEDILEEISKAPRVTLVEVQATIAKEDYLVRGTSTYCFLTLRNGFEVHGFAACADAANFNEEIGRKLARKQAVDQIWPLLGYELKTWLYRQSLPLKARLQSELTELVGRMDRLGEFTSSDRFLMLEYGERDELLLQLMTMRRYAEILNRRIIRIGDADTLLKIGA